MSAEPESTTRDWTEPGLFPAAPGVHRVPLPLPTDGLRAVNVYVIEDSDGLVLIDSGWALAEAREALSAALGKLGCGLGDVRQFLVTHVHRDHYTQAIALRRAFGAKVSIGLGEREALNVILSGSARPFAPQVAELRASGADVVLRRLQAPGVAGPAEGLAWEAPDEWLTGQRDVELSGRTLRVVPTPGHTRGHVVFIDAGAGLLFAGDHVLPHITPSIGFEPVATHLPLGDYLQSLRLVRGLPDMRLLPAHGPVTGSAHIRVDELLAHHRTRLGACAAVVAAGGGTTAYEVACQLRWTRRERRLGDLDPFNQMLAVVETRSHLELLAAQDRVTRSWEEDVAVYSPAPVAAGGGPAARSAG